MARLSFSLRILVIVLFALPSYVSASAEKSEEQLISLDISFFSPFRPSPPQLFIRNGGEIVPVRFSRRLQGDSISYEGPKILTFYTREINEDGEPRFIPAAQILLSEEMKEILLIFNLQNNENDGPNIRIIPLELETNLFPAGTLSIVNLTGLQMLGMVGEEATVVNPGLNPPIQFAENGIFPIALAFELENEIYPSFLHTVTLDPATRQILFIGTPRNVGSLRVRVRFVEDQSLLMRIQSQ